LCVGCCSNESARRRALRIRRTLTIAPGGRGASNLCMLADVGNQVYFVALTPTGEPLPDKDWAELYRVDFENERFVLQEIGGYAAVFVGA